MHGFPVRKRHNSEVHPKFRDETPKPNTPIPLDFRLDRSCDNAFDPVQFQVGTVGKDPVIKVPRNYLKSPFPLDGGRLACPSTLPPLRKPAPKLASAPNG